MMVTDTLAPQADPAEDPISGVRQQHAGDEAQEGLLTLRRASADFRQMVAHNLWFEGITPSTLRALAVNTNGDLVLHWQTGSPASRSRALIRGSGLAFVGSIQRDPEGKRLVVEAESRLYYNHAVRDSLVRCAHGLFGKPTNEARAVFLTTPPSTCTRTMFVKRRGNAFPALIGAELGQVVTGLRLVGRSAVVIIDGQLVRLPPPTNGGAFDLRLAVPFHRS